MPSTHDGLPARHALLPYALLALACALALFVGFERVGALDTREARDQVVAGELAAHHEFLIPTYANEAWLEKPLLGYAPARIAAKLAPGVEASRAIRALIAVALAALVGAIGARHFGRRAGWLAAAALSSMVGAVLAVRADGAQLLGTLFGWGACALFADVVFGRGDARGRTLTFAYAALGLALVTTGPLSALWPLGGLALYLALTRRPRAAGASGAPDADTTRRVHPLAGLTLMLGMALPWYGAVTALCGGELLARAPFFPYACETRGAWLIAPLLLPTFLVVTAFPWSALLPAAIGHAAANWLAARGALSPVAPSDEVAALRAREREQESAAHFFLAMMTAALVPIAIYPGPPLTAALPALPAAALLIGRFVDHVFEAPVLLARPLAGGARMLALTGGAVAVLLAILSTRIVDAAPALRLAGAALLVTSCAPALAEMLGRRRTAVALFALPVALGGPIFALRVLPAMESWLDTRAVAEAMETSSPPTAPLVLVEPPPPSLRLELDRNLVVGSLRGRPGAHDALLERCAATDGHAYVAFRPLRERDIARGAPAPIEILLRTPALVLARIRVR